MLGVIRTQRVCSAAERRSGAHQCLRRHRERVLSVGTSVHRDNVHDREEAPHEFRRRERRTSPEAPPNGAQRQAGGWLPLAATSTVARTLGVANVRVCKPVSTCTCALPALSFAVIAPRPSQPARAAGLARLVVLRGWLNRAVIARHNAHDDAARGSWRARGARRE